MLISISPVEGEYRMLVNTDIIATIRKESSCDGCYGYCDHEAITVIYLNDGERIPVEDSINSIEARISLAEKENAQ